MVHAPTNLRPLAFRLCLAIKKAGARSHSRTIGGRIVKTTAVWPQSIHKENRTTNKKDGELTKLLGTALIVWKLVMLIIAIACVTYFLSSAP